MTTISNTGTSSVTITSSSSSGAQLIYVCHPSLDYYCEPTSLSSGEEMPYGGYVEENDCIANCKETTSESSATSNPESKSKTYWWSFLEPIINFLFPKDKFNEDNINMYYCLFAIIIFVIFIIILINLIKNKNFNLNF